MSESLSESLPVAALPRCGHCLQKIQKGTYEAIIDDKYKERGVRLTYFCHGQQEIYDVTAVHFEMYGGSPFVETAFEVHAVAAPAIDPGQAIAAKVTEQIRSKRLKVAEFVEQTIRDVAASQSTFSGDFSKWCSEHSLRLEQPFASIRDRSASVFELCILSGKSRQVLGQFVLPFSPDDVEMKWIPTTKS